MKSFWRFDATTIPFLSKYHCVCASVDISKDTAGGVWLQGSGRRAEAHVEQNVWEVQLSSD